MKKVKQIFILCAFALVATSSQSQYFFSAGTAYLHAPDWDRVIHTLNKSTTWETDGVRPLDWAWQLGGGWNFLLFEKPQVFLTPQVRYTRWASSNSRVDLALHQLSIGSEIRFNPRALLFGVKSAGPLGPRWYMGMQPGIQMWMPTIAKNNEWLTNEDESNYHPLAVKFDWRLSTGYHFMSIGAFVATVEIQAQWIKGAELYDWTENLLGHNIVQMNNRLQKGWVLGASFLFTHVKKSENWWDRPRATGHFPDGF
jgi:hypothetical protein